MTRTEKTEIILNFTVAFLSALLAIFIAKYELYAMSKYSASLVQEDRAGMGVAAIILYIFVYLPAAGGAILLAVFLICCSVALLRAGKSKETPDFIEQTTDILKGKKRNLTLLIIVKAVATAVALFAVFASFDTAHETVLSKTVYCVALAVYAASLVSAIVCRKKIK